MLLVNKCKRCGYEWASREGEPARCAKCKSPNWKREWIRGPNMKCSDCGETVKKGAGSKIGRPGRLVCYPCKKKWLEGKETPASAGERKLWNIN